MGRLSLLAAPVTVNLLRLLLLRRVGEDGGGGLKEWLMAARVLWLGAEVPSRAVADGNRSEVRHRNTHRKPR